METFIYKPNGVCSREMQITYDGDTLIDLQVIGGCNGNLKGIKSLITNMDIDEIIAKFIDRKSPTEFEKVKASIKMPKRDLLEEQEMLWL